MSLARAIAGLSDVLREDETVQAKALAFAMLSHPRLGNDSVLTTDLIAEIGQTSLMNVVLESSRVRAIARYERYARGTTVSARRIARNLKCKMDMIVWADEQCLEANLDDLEVTCQILEDLLWSGNTVYHQLFYMTAQEWAVIVREKLV